MEQRSLRVVETDKTFFAKISNTISKILIPTRVGLNGVMISIKRNSLIKAYNNYLESTKEDEQKKYEDSYALYLEAIDKYIMDSLYKKVKNGTASNFEKEALSKYYFVVSLKKKKYLEYKYRKQEYLLRIDYETVMNMKNEKVMNKYKKFYVSKMEMIYKGLLKNYSVEIADNVNKADDDVYNKIFSTLETYITEILPIKIEYGDKSAKDEYEKYIHTTVGKLDERDKIIQKMVLLGVSRKIFIHSLPLVATEKCYIKIMKQARELIVNSKNDTKKEKAYETLFEIIEDYNIKILSTKVYWDKPEEREAYKKFWCEYEKVEKDKRKKQILFLKNDIKKLNINRKKYSKIIELHKEELTKMGAIKTILPNVKTYKKMIYNKRSA